MPSNVIELTFTSGSKLIQMNKKTEFRVLTIDGIEASEYSINTLNNNQDGAIVTCRKINAREITITGDVKKNSNEDINRQLLISFFNVKRGGELKIKRNDNEKKISYEVSSFRFTNKKMNEWQQFEIVLMCTDPLFKSIDDFGKNIASISKQFAFPLAIVPAKGGKIMGYKMFSNETALVNDGDFETGCRFNIKANGAVTNPKIMLNDKHIQINVSMKIGDILSIDTNTGHKSIKLNNNNIMQKIERTSSFFSLNVGDNIISYTCDEGYENMEIYVYFTKKYAGV